MDPSGNLDLTYGIRQIISGHGGYFSNPIVALMPNSEVYDNTSYGALKLTLHSGSYDWQFMPIADNVDPGGGSFTDSGSGNCHAAPPTSELSYHEQVLAASPAAYWRLGETSGTSAADETGHESRDVQQRAARPTGRALLRPQPLSLLLRRAELRARARFAVTRHDLGGDGRALGQATDDPTATRCWSASRGTGSLEVRELRRLDHALEEVHRLLRERHHFGGGADAGDQRHELALHRRDLQRLAGSGSTWTESSSRTSRRRCRWPRTPCRSTSVARTPTTTSSTGGSTRWRSIRRLCRLQTILAHYNRALTAPAP